MFLASVFCLTGLTPSFQIPFSPPKLSFIGKWSYQKVTPSPTPNQFIQICRKQNTRSDTTSSCNFEGIKFDSNWRISFIKNAHQKTTLMGQSYYCSFRTIPNSLSIHKLIAFIRPPNPQKKHWPPWNVNPAHFESSSF